MATSGGSLGLGTPLAAGQGDRDARGRESQHGEGLVHGTCRDGSGAVGGDLIPTCHERQLGDGDVEVEHGVEVAEALQGELPLSDGGSLDEEDEGQRAAGQGADDYQGLRSYQPGDSKRRLHWKAFSRGQGLLVKDFAALAGRDLWLDFQALGGDAEERLSRLCYWVLQLDARQQAYGLRLPGCELAPDHGDAHREACLRALALYGIRT